MSAERVEPSRGLMREKIMRVYRRSPYVASMLSLALSLVAIRAITRNARKPVKPTTAPAGLAERGHESNSRPREALLRPSIIRENTAIIVAILSVFFVATRIFSVAGYDAETAYGILQASGTGTVLVGAALSSTGTLAAVLIMACSMLYNYKFMQDQSSTRRNLTFSAVTFLVVIEVFAAPIIMLAGTAPFLLISFYPLRSPWLGRYSPPNGFALANIFPVLFIIAIFVGNTSSWLPAQEVSTARGEHITGYVLSSSQQFTVVLEAKDHKLLNVASDSISSMTFCEYGSRGLIVETIPELTMRQRYPDCP